MTRVLYTVAVAALIGAASLFAAASSAGAKTAKACEEEWKANKETIKASGKKKKDFIAECRAETAVPAEGQAKAPPDAPGKPAETAAKPEAPEAPAASAPPTQPKPAPAAKTKRSKATAALKANEFATEAEAKGHCPGAMVVWANTRSKIYHYAGHPDYGRTKQGAYMCESDTAAAGIRAAKDEKHP